jgi:lipopolysaccharide/colanic/teichoic acid biosynthesis glycosyltransferase
MPRLKDERYAGLLLERHPVSFDARNASRWSGQKNRTWARSRSKRLLDLALATLGLVLLWPALALLVILVRLDGGPALFVDRRIGLGGKAFDCLKLRTMVVDADRLLPELVNDNTALSHQWKALRKLQDDPRATTLGRVLRRTGLDELPQLVNVLRGDMSLVGPRPVPRGELTSYYGSFRDSYESVRPGLTGLWQVSRHDAMTYAERVQLDMVYISSSSFLMDALILLRTPFAILRRRSAT